MTITIRYSAIDGYRKTKRFKTLAGARNYAVERVGAHPDFGSFYAVSFDGVGKVEVEGVTLAELFGVEPKAPEPSLPPRRTPGEFIAAAVAEIDRNFPPNPIPSFGVEDWHRQAHLVGFESDEESDYYAALCRRELAVERAYEEYADYSEYRAEQEAEQAWLRQAEAGTPESWAEEDYDREVEAHGYGSPFGFR